MIRVGKWGKKAERQTTDIGLLLFSSDIDDKIN